MGQRNDVVVAAVQDKQRHGQLGDDLQARIGVGDYRSRDEGIDGMRHVTHAGERRLQDDAGRRRFDRQVQRDRSAERFTEVQDPAWIHSVTSQQNLQDSTSVPISPFLAGLAGAAAVSAVVEKEDVKTGGSQ